MPLTETEFTSKFSLVLVSEKEYLTHLNKIISSFRSKDRKICYVSLVRSHMEVVEELKRENVNVDNFYFIDVVIGKGRDIPETENCVFMHTTNMDDLQNRLKKVIKEKNCQIVLFDTVSALLMYEQKHDIIRFTHNILSDKHYKTANNIYIVIKDLGVKTSENQNLVKDLRMFADKEIHLK